MIPPPSPSLSVPSLSPDVSPPPRSPIYLRCPSITWVCSDFSLIRSGACGYVTGLPPSLPPFSSLLYLALSISSHLFLFLLHPYFFCPSFSSSFSSLPYSPFLYLFLFPHTLLSLFPFPFFLFSLCPSLSPPPSCLSLYLSLAISPSFSSPSLSPSLLRSPFSSVRTFTVQAKQESSLDMHEIYE